MKKPATLQAIQMLKEGLTPRQIRARLPEVASATITREASAIGLRFRRGQPRGPSPALEPDRRRARQLRASGLQMHEIGALMHRSHQSVSNLLK